MYRLRPFEQPEPLQRMDPLTRGSLFHEIQASFFRTLQSQSALPVTARTSIRREPSLDEVIEQIGVRAHDELVPAVERVWQDELATIRRDLHAWLEYLARDGEEWMPVYFELAFGAVPGERDEHSIRGDVVIDGRFRLRGAIDLIEEHAQTKALRITDHKTGRKPDRIEKVLIGGGAVLQPILYSMAVEDGARTRGESRATVLLHIDRQLLLASDPARRAIACGRPRSARGGRSRDRDRVPGGGTDRRGVRAV